MLKEDVAGLLGKYPSIEDAILALRALLDHCSEEEFLRMMFDQDGETARLVIDSILNEQDKRRRELLEDLSQHIPAAQREFFVHAFSLRSESDDPFP